MAGKRTELTKTDHAVIKTLLLVMIGESRTWRSKEIGVKHIVFTVQQYCWNMGYDDDKTGAVSFYVAERADALYEGFMTEGPEALRRVMHPRFEEIYEENERRLKEIGAAAYLQEIVRGRRFQIVELKRGTDPGERN